MRVKLIEDLTLSEKVVVEAIGERQTVAHIAKAMGTSEWTVRNHVKNATKKIPGTIPGLTRIHLWWTGASLEQLHAWVHPHARQRGKAYPCECGRCDSLGHVRVAQ